MANIVINVQSRGGSAVETCSYPSIMQNSTPAYSIQSVDNALNLLLMLRRDGVLRVSDAAADREIVFPLGPEHKGHMTGADYLNHFMLPNFYFHCTAAYAILRHNGVDIGKRDFLGPV